MGMRPACVNAIHSSLLPSQPVRCPRVSHRHRAPPEDACSGSLMKDKERCPFETGRRESSSHPPFEVQRLHILQRVLVRPQLMAQHGRLFGLGRASVGLDLPLAGGWWALRGRLVSDDRWAGIIRVLEVVGP